MSAREAAESVVQRERTYAEKCVTLELRRHIAEERSRQITRWLWVMIVVGAIVNGLIIAW